MLEVSLFVLLIELKLMVENVHKTIPDWMITSRREEQCKDLEFSLGMMDTDTLWREVVWDLCHSRVPCVIPCCPLPGCFFRQHWDLEEAGCQPVQYTQLFTSH